MIANIVRIADKMGTHFTGDSMVDIIGTLNQPWIKQEIKNLLGFVTFGLGANATYDAVRGKIYTRYARDTKTDPYLTAMIDRITYLFAHTSLILSAAISPLGITFISFAVNRVFTSAQLAKVFGPYTTFESHWKHPRHIASFAAVGLAIPMFVKHLFMIPKCPEKEERLFERAIWTILTSRPILHHGNLLLKRIFVK